VDFPAPEIPVTQTSGTGRVCRGAARSVAQVVGWSAYRSTRLRSVEFPADDGLVVVLQSFGVGPEGYLGHGGQAWVYALGDDRVVRVLHDGTNLDSISLGYALIDELRAASASFALPELLELGEREGRCFTIERRLPGRALMQLLAMLDRDQRDALVEHHLDVAAALGSLHLTPRGWFGDLLAERPIRSASWAAYLRDRASMSLAGSTHEFAQVDAESLAAALPDTTAASFVHLDAFAGNMMATPTAITAVLDIGPTSASGDARLDPVAAVVYLSSPEITPVVTPRDVDVAMSLLRSAGLVDWFEPAQRWLAAFWSSAVDDRRPHDWCRRVLL
jgi:aminoglycoside phosphotransferase (APT) family kinase protein